MWARPSEIGDWAHWAVVVLVVCVAYSAFRSVFRFVSDNISDIVCVACTHTTFLIKKVEGSLSFSDYVSVLFCVVYTETTRTAPDDCV